MVESGDFSVPALHLCLNPVEFPEVLNVPDTVLMITNDHDEHADAVRGAAIGRVRQVDGVACSTVAFCFSR